MNGSAAVGTRSSGAGAAAGNLSKTTWATTQTPRFEIPARPQREGNNHMEKATKHAQSAELRERIEDLTALVLVEYHGLTVAESDELRGKFREAGCTYRVYKNSVIRYAVAGTPLEPITPLLKGVSGLAYNADDPGAPARVARAFAKDNDKLRLKGAVVEGQVLEGEAANKLADMPGPREIKAKLLMLFKTPATRMVQVMNAAPRDFLCVLMAKKAKDEEAA